VVVRLGRDGVHSCSVFWRQRTAVIYRRHGPAVDRTERRHPAEERTQSRLETSAGKTVRVPKSGTQIVRVLPENESAFPGLDHIARMRQVQVRAGHRVDSRERDLR